MSIDPRSMAQTPLEVASNVRLLADRLNRLSDSSTFVAVASDSRPERFRDPSLEELGSWATLAQSLVDLADLILLSLDNVKAIPARVSALARARVNALGRALSHQIDNALFNWHQSDLEDRVAFKIAKAEASSLRMAIERQAVSEVAGLRDIAVQIEAAEAGERIGPTEAIKLWKELSGFTPQGANKAFKKARGVQLSIVEGKVLRREVERLAKAAKAQKSGNPTRVDFGEDMGPDYDPLDVS